MKRKFSIFITLLLALVLCFALVACDTDPDGKANGGGKTLKKEEVIDKALTSLGEYFDGDVYGGVLGYDLNTKNTEGLKGSYKFVKKNNEVYYKDGDTVNMFDLNTNMTYVKKQDGWFYDGELLPQGTFEYLIAVIDRLSTDDDSVIEESAASGDGMFSYDDIVYNAKNRTLTTEVKLAERVNRPLLPLQQVYEEEGSIKKLIDAYLWEYNDDIVAQVPLLKALGTPLNVNKISILIKTTLVGAKNENMINTLESFVGNDIGTKYEDFLKSQGVTGEALTAAKSRTIGQAIEGALKYIEEKVDLKAIAQGDYSSVLGIVDSLVNGSDEERAAVLGEMLQYVVFSEVDMKNYETDVADFVDMIVDFMQAVKIKPLIDGLENLQIPGMSSTISMVLGIAGPVIKEIIAKPVTFEKLDAKVAVKLDKEYAVESISIEFIAKHDFKGETTLPFLSDNDYSASITMLLSGVPEELDVNEEIQLVKYTDENGVVLDGGGYGIMNLENGVDFRYYLETRMINNPSVDEINTFVVSADGEIAEVKTAIVSFDVNTSSFVYDYDAVSAAVADELHKGAKTAIITTTATVHVGEIFNYTVNVRLFVVADASTDSAEELITSLVSYAFGDDVDAPMESVA